MLGRGIEAGKRQPHMKSLEKSSHAEVCDDLSQNDPMVRFKALFLEYLEKAPKKIRKLTS
jgi:hypothetical protein